MSSFFLTLITMSSDPTTPYDEERESLGMLIESVEELESEPPDPGSDTALLEQLLELLSVDSSADDEDDRADITSSFAHTSMSDQEIVEWQHNISAEPGTSLAALHMHTARAPVHLQAERPMERTHQVSPDPPSIFFGSVMISCSPMQCLVPIVG
jgi:hypothetical protein